MYVFSKFFFYLDRFDLSIPFIGLRDKKQYIKTSYFTRSIISEKK